MRCRLVLGSGVLLCAGFLAPLQSSSAAEDSAELKSLFDRSAGKHDEEAEKRLVALGDDAVPFLVGVILAKEPHLLKYTTI
jgi:hypothetical protein